MTLGPTNALLYLLIFAVLFGGRDTVADVCIAAAAFVALIAL